jgi:outer membrane biosynthesis protein TonB
MIAELDPIPEPEAPEPAPEPEPEPEPEASEPAVVVPKRRGRPPGAKNKPKAKPRVEFAPEAEEAPSPEPPPAYSKRDLLRATQFFASQLGSLQRQRMDTKRNEWRALFG